MKNSDYIPHKDAEFLQWTNNFINYPGTIIRKVECPEDVYGELTTQHEDFAQKLEAATEPATRTTLTVQAKNTARADFEKALRQAVIDN
ncbi:MAG: hypothetical protein LBP85_04095 [Prevotellaceae bacterium]|jgi:hypothetical protein|nr:hypothetical protein [Prevotellaceae bacterium]